LDAFLEWVVDGGVSAARATAWRPIAEKLVRMAGNGRILEGHILSLIDASQGSPGQVTLIEEVGEALLRYQALAKTSELRPTREIPRLRSPTQPPITTPTSAPVPDKVVSFEVPSQPPPAPAPQPATPPGGLAIGSVPPGHRTSNVHFRCPKCKMMVAANDDGVCPNCSTRPPSAVMTTERPRASIGWRVALVALVVVAALVVVRLGARVVDRLSHPSVSGTYPAHTIGLQLTFVEDWRKNTEGQANLGAIGLDEAMAVARFSRDDGDLAVASAPRPADFTDARLGQLADSGPDKVAAPLRTLAGEVRLDTCIASGRRMRCLGADGSRRAAAYVVLLPKQVVVMVMSSTRNLEDITAEADVLVDSLRSL